jgi:transposase
LGRQVSQTLPDAEIVIADKGFETRVVPPGSVRSGHRALQSRTQEPKGVDDAKIDKRRNLVERMFGRLKDWCRIATRYDRYARSFISAVCVAAAVIFWA